MTSESREDLVPHDPYRKVFAALFELTKAVNAGHPLRALLVSVGEAVTELFHADGCAVMLFERDSKSPFCAAASGWAEPIHDVDGLLHGDGPEAWVAHRAEPLRLSEDATWPGGPRPTGSLLCVPLAGKDGVMGILTVRARRADAFTAEDEELLLYIGGLIVKDLENARLYRLSITDTLTGAYNRQYLYQRLPDEMERARRYSDPLSLILFDVDKFKAFNDTYGHSAGDFVLKAMIETVRGVIREVDGLARYGGEEFILLLPKTGLKGAGEAAERLRSAVSNTRFVWNNRPLQVTVSLGVATLTPDMHNEEALIRRADELLYQAKREGRNRLKAG